MKESKAYITLDSNFFDKIKKISGRDDYEELVFEDGILVDSKHIIYMLDDLLDELDYQQNQFEEREQQFLTRISALEGSLNIKRNN